MEAAMELAMKVQSVIVASHGQKDHQVASSGNYRHRATCTCDAGGSARGPGFRGLFDRGAASLPQATDCPSTAGGTYPTLQLKPGAHSTLDHSGTCMGAKAPEGSRCCIRVFQGADSGRLLCERDQQNVHADGLQI